MDNGQSVCSTVSPALFTSLIKEVKRNGRSAINNRLNLAASLRDQGSIEEAERAEMDARIMAEIARRNNIRIA